MKKPANCIPVCVGILLGALIAGMPGGLFSAEPEDSGRVRREAEAAQPDLSAGTNVAGGVRLDQQSLEWLRRQIEQSTSRNAEAITAGLSLLEPTLARMHDRQMEAVQSSTRTVLIVAGIFGAVGFLGLVFISLILVRAIGRFSEFAVMGPPRGQLGPAGPGFASLGSGEPTGPRPGAAEQAAGRFQAAIEQLQIRIGELETSTQSPQSEAGPGRGGSGRNAAQPKLGVESIGSALNIQPLLQHPYPEAAPASEPAAPASRATLLLGKGQALLNLDATEQALQCFDDVLALDPGNAEAHVKKGMALEKLQDWEQALECYNRAIAVDATLTVAYLYRGGVCNRLQRYREALESYEQALRTEKKSRAS